MPRNTTKNCYTDSNPSQKNRGQHEMFGQSYWQASGGWSSWRVENLLKGEGAKALEQEGEPWQTWQKWGRMAQRLLSFHVPNSSNYSITTVERIVPLEESSKQGSVFASQVFLDYPVWKTGVSKDLLEHMNFSAKGCRLIPEFVLLGFWMPHTSSWVKQGWGCGYHNASSTDAETWNGELRREAHLFMGSWHHPPTIERCGTMCSSSRMPDCLPQTLKEVLTPGGEESIAYHFRPQRYPELPRMEDMCQAGSPSTCGSCCFYSHHQAPRFQDNNKRQCMSEAISPVK